MPKKKVERKEGKLVKNKHRKWQIRIYITGDWTCDLIPVRWKYFKLDTSQRTPLDKPSYAIKWLFFTLRFERVRMSMRQ